MLVRTASFSVTVQRISSVFLAGVQKLVTIELLQYMEVAKAS